MMRIAITAWCLVAASLLLVRCSAAAVADPVRRELLRVRVVNDANGDISVSRDQGESWTTVGRVTAYTHQVTRKGYTASKWVPAGQVAATAVNAIHINAGYDEENDRGIVFSLLPAEMNDPGQGYTSFLSPNSSLYTDIAAGSSIFGGGEAPFVGSQVHLEGLGQALEPVPAGYVPKQGDVLVILVELPARYPVAAVFENRAGGAVWLIHGDGGEEQCGWVIRPVRGVGRFLGALYAGIGRVRANHAGVIDVSTSLLGELGAFQIIPVGHALSPEMGIAWRLSQWLIVGPLGESDALWDGLSPLFYQHLRPDYRSDDLLAADWKGRLLSRFLVEADLGKGWQPMPALRLSPSPEEPLPEWAGEALGDVERVRILFPLLPQPGG